MKLKAYIYIYIERERERERRKMVVKVYGSVRAAFPQRVLACLIEKGVEFEVVHMDLDSGDQKRPHFLLLPLPSLFQQNNYIINWFLFITLIKKIHIQ